MFIQSTQSVDKEQSYILQDLTEMERATF